MPPCLRPWTSRSTFVGSHIKQTGACRHIETILASRLRRSPALDPYARRILRLPDGGSVALDFEDFEHVQDLPQDAPVVILLPGLTGGSHDSYVKYMVRACRRKGLRAIVFNSRGTSDGPVTTPQFYSASFTGDMRAVVKEVQSLFPDSALLAAGWSLGANILVRYLGEEGPKTPISAAISMCNPFNLVMCDDNFHVGFNRIYDRNLAASLCNIYKRHEHLFEGIGGDYQLDLAANCKTIRDFDDAITRVSFGWPSVDAYYAGSSSSLSVPNVAIPLLCIQAEDDPIAVKGAIPYEALADNPNCALVVTPGGGHLGWAAGPEGPLSAPWADNASTEWLNSVLLELYRHGKLPVKPSESSYARVGGRQGADRSVERATDAEPGQLLQVK
ncbi:AB-hydrolase YheT [Coccomyxa subellipsoidea C-169]|uniref:AB-hydrolase YheT n=1 Tax=Coccomyxa subellipsoidea (strain C-169) TaxID=574566 RepID=I0YWE3_COCSC|nr:AB-hydrolase YheT [Coccomyxa subellipsoidea C-169]EIE22712.1 AB-hydrolase YheT [Coccomyxa subellipsoidea C-169]|eukprot:XP_005647256.1 AB-hydrolase YheT [Coccomyxa subellipsoidea C-169]